LKRALRLFASTIFMARLWPWSRASWVQQDLIDDYLDGEAALHAPNTTGLPEADLSEEQRQEAIRRMRNKPRIG
jgi:hypothetical protein